MPGVSIHYDDGSTVESCNLADALLHVAHQGALGVVEIREQPEPPGPCATCGGTGQAKQQSGKRLLTRKQIDAKAAEIVETAEVPPADPNEPHPVEVVVKARHDAAKRVAKALDG